MPLVGNKLPQKKCFYYSLLFQEISSFFLSLFSSFCFKGHTPHSEFFFFQKMVEWMRINWMQKDYSLIYQESRYEKSRSPKQGQCGWAGCWCRKQNGTPEYPNTSAWDGFLRSFYYHARDLLAYIHHCSPAQLLQPWRPPWRREIV